MSDTVWIVLIVAAALIVGLALWLGRSIKIKKGSDGFSVETEGEEKPEDETKVRVGENLVIKDSTAGDVTGIVDQGEGKEGASKEDVEVLKGGKIENTDLGDITGVKKGNQSSE